MNKLNIGCGKNWANLSDFDGIDVIDFGQKYVWNIEETPWMQIKDNSYNELRAWNTLEHIHQDKVVQVMNECYRILKLNGKFNIKVPRFPHINSVKDPTHYSYWVPETFTDYFIEKDVNFDYGIKKWSIEKMDLDETCVVVCLYKGGDC